ncbi:MAG: hypothetical protein J7L16_08190, partial [Deltaproteobacteria bacterium]|nr:hypothetical protein [Deltaproteobacteria bacterium]
MKIVFVPYRNVCPHYLSSSVRIYFLSVQQEAVRKCPFPQTLRYAQKIILEISASFRFSLHLNPASVEFAEDLPAAGRCKAARAQTY